MADTVAELWDHYVLGRNLNTKTSESIGILVVIECCDDIKGHLPRFTQVLRRQFRIKLKTIQALDLQSVAIKDKLRRRRDDLSIQICD